MFPSRHASLRALLLGAIGCQATTEPGPSCQNPVPVPLADGRPSGFQRCADGALNRAAPTPYEAVNIDPACQGTEVQRGCDTDAQCTSGPNGRCVQRTREYTFCGCEYTCATDADCAAGQACVPQAVTASATHPVCVTATCKTGADCPSGECGLADSDNGCGFVTELRCRDTERDQCRADGDCAELGVGFTCDVEGFGSAFTCVTRSCVIGRPLLVQGTARVAPPVRRADWIA